MDGGMGRLDGSDDLSESLLPLLSNETKRKGGTMTNPDDSAVRDGLTKRELFSVFAMKGILASGNISAIDPESVATYALKYADALIAELNKGTK
jgi:hypothetical protein